MRYLLVLLLPFLAACLLSDTFAEEADQQDIPYMADWPRLPIPFRMRNWQDTARRVTLLTLDAEAAYPYFPVTKYFLQEEPLSGGAQGQQFGVQTYLRATSPQDAYGEAVAQLAAVVTASMTDGIDPHTLYGLDFVDMAKAYFSRTPDGRGFISNNTPVDDCPGSYWYTLYPTCLYFHLAALHPEDAELQSHMREVADTWLEAVTEIPTWDAQGYSLKNHTLEPGNHTEPEGILGAAYVMLMAHERLGDARYLETAKALMQEATLRTTNPYYEILGSYAPYTAARLNAQYNAGLPLARMLDWVFNDGSEAARPGWGVINARWGDYDAYGLSGSLTDTQGYAFSMNTFVTAGMLAPVARYAPQYSRALGQYLTAVAANSELFFADGLPAELQDDSAYTAQTGLTDLVYEGVRNLGKTTPYATGDAKVFAPNVEGTNFSFYSSGPIGLFSALIGRTNVPEILMFDLLKTDFEHRAAYPTYLLYNPLDEAKEVAMPLPDGNFHDVYDAVSGQYLAKDVTGSAAFVMYPDTAVQAVILPAGAPLMESQGRIEAEGIVVRYDAAWLELTAVEEYALLHEGDILPLEAHLPVADRIVSCIVTLDGEVVAETDDLACIQLPLPEGSRRRASLNIAVHTEQGRHLGLSRSIQVLPAAAQPVIQLTGKALKNTFPRTDNCRAYLEENIVRLKVTNGSSSFMLPMMKLHADQNAWVALKIPHASAAWSVHLYLNSTGETIPVQPEWQRTGEYLLPLSGLLRSKGLEQANVKVMFTLGSGGTGEVTLEYLNVYAQNK